MHYDMCVERKEDKENMNKFLKGAMIVGLSAAMVGCSSNVASDDSDSKNESLSGTITAAGSSALKPLVDVAAEQFSNENLDVSITVDAGGSGEGGSLTLAHSRNSQMSFMYGFFFVKFLFFTVVCVVIVI